MTDCEAHSHTVVAAIGQPTIPPRYRAVDMRALGRLPAGARGADLYAPAAPEGLRSVNVLCAGGFGHAVRVTLLGRKERATGGRLAIHHDRYLAAAVVREGRPGHQRSFRTAVPSTHR